jgi:hypothetical protein
MALYAFDGTWNSDKPGTEKDTNVIWFHNAYTGPKRYWAGVGTRLSFLGKVAGGITGAGGHQRIREGLVELTENFAAGDTIVDVVGFSRGAALAVDFANEVAKQAGLPGPTPAAVRFLGVWELEPFRTLRITDAVHVCVTPRQDKDGRHHNNPPASLPRINDKGEVVTGAAQT